MASPPQHRRVGQPSVPGDHWDFKQLLLTVNAWGMAPPRRGAAGPQRQCSGQCFCRGAGRRCFRALGQESPGSPDPRKQRPDPIGELPKRLPSALPAGWGCNVGCQVRRAEGLPSPPLTCFSVMA